VIEDREYYRIKIFHLQRTYQQGEKTVHAVRDASLEIAPGAFTLIIGPSGSGKSTLLHLIGGLDTPDGGEIQVGGAMLHRLSKDHLARYRQTMVGFIFQSFHRIPSMPVQENVALPLVLRNFSRPEREARVASLLEQVGLADKARQRTWQLSGGQQQRVAIARALVSAPPILLADEPTGNLDSATGLGIMQIFQELNRSGKTVIMVTHNEHYGDYASQIVEMRDGEII
jgi:ABC-type lipoprotein export system ATPase subunit